MPAREFVRARACVRVARPQICTNAACHAGGARSAWPRAQTRTYAGGRRPELLSLRKRLAGDDSAFQRIIDFTLEGASATPRRLAPTCRLPRAAAARRRHEGKAAHACAHARAPCVPYDVGGSWGAGLGLGGQHPHGGPRAAVVVGCMPHVTVRGVRRRAHVLCREAGGRLQPRRDPRAVPTGAADGRPLGRARARRRRGRAQAAQAAGACGAQPGRRDVKLEVAGAGAKDERRAPA